MQAFKSALLLALLAVGACQNFRHVRNVAVNSSVVAQDVKKSEDAVDSPSPAPGPEVIDSDDDRLVAKAAEDSGSPSAATTAAGSSGAGSPTAQPSGAGSTTAQPSGAGSSGAGSSGAGSPAAQSPASADTANEAATEAQKPAPNPETPVASESSTGAASSSDKIATLCSVIASAVALSF